MRYLQCIDNYNTQKGKISNYADTFRKNGIWPDNIQIPRNNNFLDENGNIKYGTLAPDAGYLKGTKQTLKDGIGLPKKGTKIEARWRYSI